MVVGMSVFKLVDYIVEAAVLKTAIITSEVMRKKG